MKKITVLKVFCFVLALIFTVSAIRLAWLRIGGNEAINYVHIAIPVILGAMSVREYRVLKKKEKAEPEAEK